MGRDDVPLAGLTAPQPRARPSGARRDRFPLDGSREQPQAPPHHRHCDGGKPQGARESGPRAQAEIQVMQWFGSVPDFIITLDAECCRACNDQSLCLSPSTFTQETDAFGAPRFSRSTGRPVFTIRGHDVEEFVAWFVAMGQMPPISARSPTRPPARTSPTLAAPARLRLRERHSALRTRCLVHVLWPLGPHRRNQTRRRHRHLLDRGGTQPHPRAMGHA